MVTSKSCPKFTFTGVVQAEIPRLSFFDLLACQKCKVASFHHADVLMLELQMSCHSTFQFSVCLRSWEPEINCNYIFLIWAVDTVGHQVWGKHICLCKWIGLREWTILQTGNFPLCCCVFLSSLHTTHNKNFPPLNIQIALSSHFIVEKSCFCASAATKYWEAEILRPLAIRNLGFYISLYCCFSVDKSCSCASAAFNKEKRKSWGLLPFKNFGFYILFLAVSLLRKAAFRHLECATNRDAEHFWEQDLHSDFLNFPINRWETETTSFKISLW